MQDAEWSTGGSRPSVPLSRACLAISACPCAPSAEQGWAGCGTGPGCLAQGLSSGLGAPGRAGGALCPSSLLSFLPYIQRFIFYTRCHLRLMGAHWARRPRCCALSACSTDSSHSGWWDSTLQPPALSPGACQSPWPGHGHCGGLGVVLFCFALCSWGWMGGLFSIWPERGLPNESQVNNTFFKKKPIQMSALEYPGN